VVIFLAFGNRFKITVQKYKNIQREERFVTHDFFVLRFLNQNITFVKNGSFMPTLSMFFGIIIRMYFAPKEHNPPHIHAYYQDLKTIIDIETCEILEGQLPPRQLRLVFAWIEIHKEELLANWKLCQNGEKPFAIEPLK
jgi:hypothetical protein